MTDTPPKDPLKGPTSTSTSSTAGTTSSSTTKPATGTSDSLKTSSGTGTAPTTGSGGDRLKHTAEEAKDSFAKTAKSTAQEGRARVEEGMDKARERVMSSSEDAKNNAAEEIGRTADALDTAASEVDEGSVQQQLLREAADGLTRISGSMKGKNLGDIVGDISQFGREHPAAFLGGAALAGFALARFARASEESGPASRLGTVSDPYATSPVRPAPAYTPPAQPAGTATTYPSSDFGGVKP